ncbi:ArnT family glycosyltransferase [Algoriphagus limi]|uniref:Glycosyltransferase family 39 protein n=1 Tax=Algoriphagus limi TaxID=2975273 RepID=A0ABT2G9P7_9BACT|nr:glycosyltransferase family 39 protein [Algoriphagus limi]MCS5491483.1 glycosyltransferase family 39 protein [Algoriphagus limi]
MIFSKSTELKINPWILMGVFCVLVGPFALNFHMNYPDEMYYRDAAVEMLRNGDYLTTYLGSGELRFKKPIVTYWAVLAGFKLFGVNAFASRIFFLLAGAATIGLTFKLAKILFKEEKIAFISALIMAANPVLILSSGRSIPDILLVCSMTLSALGFASYLKNEDGVPRWTPWALFGGLALAFEVKGLPAAALGGIGIIYLIVNPWKKIPLKSLFHLPSILVSLVVALFWFVAMWIIHGPTYLESFLEDQVGERVASRGILIVKHGLQALGLMLAMFVPWVFFTFPKLKTNILKAWKENTQFSGFALLWALAILGMGSLTIKFYERYLLPVAPVLAVYLGWILVKGEFEIRKLGLKAAAIFFYLLNIILLAAGFYLALKGHFIWIRMALIVAVLVYVGKLIWSNQKLPKAITYSYILIFLSYTLFTSLISFPHPGKQIQLELQEMYDLAPSEIGFRGNNHVASKIRISIYPKTRLTNLDKINWRNQLSEYDYLILEDEFYDSLDRENFIVQKQTVNWSSKAIPDLIKAFGKPQYDSILNASGKKFYLLRPNKD